ncbi:hypothetical protein [Millionella massiliensis]|uniref:hypothetical protein n=1 Tax=Millionella massiliensis TaxID=1871023 RepID=UPI0008DA85C5|nr:hypothetical protein [Millionella massiliensis]
MIEVKNRNGEPLYSAPVTTEALFRHELMTEEYVQLVFNEVSQVDFPIGCYLEHEGRKYVVTTLVYPELIDGGYKYSIRFEAEWMRWRNISCFFVNEFTGKPEANWSMTATPDLFLQQITRNISRAIGQTYTFAYDSSLTATKDLTFDNKTVLEALSMIAEAFETEWWVEGSVIHLSRCEHGEAVVLTQGVNIGAPTSSGESEYATRIYAYGSTRNITQDYQSGGTTNALVEKRLTLPVDRYPNGYRDIKAGLSAEEIIEKTVIFDDIYPSSDFPISSVRMDLRLDTDTIVGTNEDGTPIYDTCPVYYFKIEGIDFSDELIIEGQTLKVHFLSGHLQGREFELAYHSTSKEYEIVTDRENGAVKLPNETLMPQDGDTVILFNIQMPDEYVTSAENRLAEALETYVNETILADTYTYSFASNPVAFAKESIALTVGQKVTLNYVFGTLDTRVLSVEFPLYAPSKMEISVGENTPKGKLETIETETVNASSQIEIIQAYNNAAKTIQNQLNRATQIMAEGLAKLGNMWYIDKSQDTTADKSDSSKWIIRTSYPVSTDQWIAQFGIYTGGEGGGSGSGTMYHDQLEHLDYPDQHPIAAIAGLQSALDAKANSSLLAGAILGKGWDSSLNTTEVGTGFQRLSEGSSTVGPYISFGHSGYIAQLTVGYTDYAGYSDMLKYRVRNGESASWTDWKTIWHSGNDGANSGLDADLLDGRQASEFWGHFLTIIDASALSEDYYYPVTIYVAYRNRVRISVMVDLDSKTKPSWSTHANGFSCRFIEEVSGDGWGAIAKNRVVLDSTYKWANKNPIGKVDQMTNTNNEVIYVRGGGKYYFYTSQALTVTLRTSAYTGGGQTVSPILASSINPEPHKAGDGLVGLSTLYCNSIVIGGHIITWDSTNNALKIDGSVYTTGSITQLKS